MTGDKFHRVKQLLSSVASCFFFFSSRRRHTSCLSDWSSDVCSSDLSWTTAAPMRFLATTSTDCHADGDRYVGTCRYPGQWARGGTVRSCDGRRSSSPDLSNLGPRNGNRR